MISGSSYIAVLDQTPPHFDVGIFLICLTSFWVSFRRNHFLYVAVDAVHPWKEVNLGSSYVTSQTETFFLNGHIRNEDLEEKCKFHCKGK